MNNLLQRVGARESRLAVIGLGYVGLPLAAEFGRHFPTLGFDINPCRIAALRQGADKTREVSAEALRGATRLSFTGRPEDLAGTDIFIVTVPTPVDRFKRPDLRLLLGASETVGRALRPGGLVIYESTVYPGCTEEDCAPILERASGLTFNRDFACGYSPERINPGDRAHTLTRIVKITSGSTPEAAETVDALYRVIVAAGTHRAPGIRVAEAAKVIENSQRDINIAFVNELALIFERMGLDTAAVLEAAGTKWNFLPFRPGLVGGHCIGVDPYYLTHKAEALGYHPEIILAGRRLNDNMGIHVAQRVVKCLIRKGRRVQGARVLVLGLTFKENCTDCRNARVRDVIRELRDFGCAVSAFDPWVDPADVRAEYGFDPLPELQPGAPFGGFDAVVLAVPHEPFLALDFASLAATGTVLYDVRRVLPRGLADGGL